ncbi:MAG: DNA recombination protein RmuC [Alphaproteobacteria bacterium]|nr:DNA recombination protein RmuC [Alphaproteobacteria bacterium]
MGSVEILAAILAFCLVAAVVMLALRLRGGVDVGAVLADSERRREDAAERLAAMQSELAGRLGQMAESQTIAQARLAEQLQIQERELSKKLEERLADVTRRVGEGLEKSYKTTETSLTDLKQRLAVIDVAQKNITELSTQVVGLQDILANKQARGAFGEIQLNDLVSQALPPSAYAFQATVGGNRRVDCLLTLPNPPGSIAIDAKFPLEHYQVLRQAGSDVERDAARKALGQAITVHVKAIAERYIVPGETAESALMFLPSEAVYAELHASLPAVVQDAFRRKVWIVSPTTLMATLHTVRAVLKDASMREQAHVIQVEVTTLLKDVERLDERVGKLQTHFGHVEKDMREIRISTDKITKRGERIQEIEVEDPASLAPASVPAAEADEDDTHPRPRLLAGE